MVNGPFLCRHLFFFAFTITGAVTDLLIMDYLQSSPTTLQMQVGSCQRLNSYDFISQMPDDVLIKILSLVSIKDAVATSGVTTRWRYLWLNLRQLNFDAWEIFLNNIDSADHVVKSAEEKYIKSVNSVIKSYNHPTIIKRKVEFLELDLSCDYLDWCSRGEGYDFPSELYNNNDYIQSHEFPYIKKIVLKMVYVSQDVFEAFLKNFPNLEMISIHHPRHLYRFDVNGQFPNLKHLEIVDICYGGSIYLSDLDNLVSFTFKGYDEDLRLAHLPKLKELHIYMIRLNVKNVFDQIWSFALSMQSLSLTSFVSAGDLIIDSVPKLPNLKKFRLKAGVGGNGEDHLIFLDSIMNACLILETISIETEYISPIINRKKVSDAANIHEHLKLFEIVNCWDRNPDFELATYIIQTAVALEKVVIKFTRARASMEEEAQSFAERIKLIIPQSVVELIMECLQSSSTTLQMQVGSHQRLNSYDFASQMPDDVLIKILSFVPIKDAVATSGVATR
ncbi:F-box/FBD/LRR-repeat protein At4g26340-like [Rutidosis leptorrhynchoides]|uniref:F-box/FBD/LRR-repeat protein At4g26340-like n=1 Tax=Rutidosis leptorrhynchoides TaxID=125765 RepID=UPI003A9976AB